MQYKAIVNNGEVTSEEGAFFKAAPFKVSVEDRQYEADFLLQDNGVAVYEIKKGDQSIMKLTHPDYVPEKSRGVYVDPGSLSQEEKEVFAALVYLKISKAKEYIAFYKEEKYDFEVTQSDFLVL